MSIAAAIVEALGEGPKTCWELQERLVPLVTTNERNLRTMLGVLMRNGRVISAKIDPQPTARGFSTKLYQLNPEPPVIPAEGALPRAGVFSLQRYERSKEFARLYESGMTMQAIGDRFGMTRERVRQILAQRGVTGGQNLDRDIPLLQNRVQSLEERVTLLEAKL